MGDNLFYGHGFRTILRRPTQQALAATDMWERPERMEIDSAIDAYFRIARMVAANLLNKVPGTTPITGWNKPGCIDQYVLGACNVAEGDSPEEILAIAVLAMFQEFIALNSAKNPGGIGSRRSQQYTENTAFSLWVF